MPLIENSAYSGPPPHLFNGMLQTIAAHKFRRFPQIDFKRERITLPDGDFLDLDWLRSKQRNNKLAVLTHGLEGNSQRPYIRTLAKLFADNGWDILAWNCRSCSGEINLAPRLYYHGDTGDLDQVMEHALSRSHYETASLIGVSMGGSINLKYAGVCQLPEQLNRIVAISVPCKLSAASAAMDEYWNRLIFKTRFMVSLRQKLYLKAKQFPGLIDIGRLDEIKQWRDLDEWFSAPMFGFKNADELYEAGSAENFLSDIPVNTLILNALNDPILPAACSPVQLCESLEKVWLEVTEDGGHAGYTDRKPQYYTYAERRALEFSEN